MTEDLRLRIEQLILEYNSQKTKLNNGTRDFFLQAAVDILREVLDTAK